MNGGTVKRAAFTLVEALVAITLASVILVVLWQVFSSANREAADAERRLQSVATLQRMSQALEADLALVAPVGDESRIQVGDKTGTLSFRAARMDPKGAPGEGMIVFAPLTYKLDRATHQVLRTEVDASAGPVTRPVPGVRLLDLRFRLTPRLDVFADLVASAAASPDCLLVQAVWAPAEDLAANRTPLEKDVVSLSMAFGLAHLSDDARYPGWVTNPTSRAQLLGE